MYTCYVYWQNYPLQFDMFMTYIYACNTIIPYKVISLCVYECVCVYVCVCMCMCVYVCCVIEVIMCVCVCMQAHMCVCVCVSVCICAYVMVNEMQPLGFVINSLHRER